MQTAADISLLPNGGRVASGKEPRTGIAALRLDDEARIDYLRDETGNRCCISAAAPFLMLR